MSCIQRSEPLPADSPRLRDPLLAGSTTPVGAPTRFRCKEFAAALGQGAGAAQLSAGARPGACKLMLARRQWFGVSYCMAGPAAPRLQLPLSRSPAPSPLATTPAPREQAAAISRPIAGTAVPKLLNEDQRRLPASAIAGPHVQGPTGHGEPEGPPIHHETTVSAPAAVDPATSIAPARKGKTLQPSSTARSRKTILLTPGPPIRFQSIARQRSAHSGPRPGALSWL